MSSRSHVWDRVRLTCVLHAGTPARCMLEQVLEYNQDPAYLRDLLLYRLTPWAACGHEVDGEDVDVLERLPTPQPASS